MTKHLGLDIGALFVKLVVTDGEKLVYSAYEAHKGSPLSCAQKLVAGLEQGEYFLGITGSNGHLLAGPLALQPINFIEAEMETVRNLFPSARNILNIGGGSCTIIHLDENGNFLNYSGNSLCAAGTGSFLDEQARRLEINYEMMKSFVFDDVPPSIASRCAVFAKSDLIHRQQEGYSKEAMWAGLCKGCVDTFLQTLLKGKPLKGETIVTGGVSLNNQILHRLNSYFGNQVQTWSHAHLAGAIGAARSANGTPISKDKIMGIGRVESEGESGTLKRGRPLVLEKSKYPSFAVHHEFVDGLGNEVRIWNPLSEGTLEVTVGIDIGSTSTKMVLLGRDKDVVVDIYRKTLGDPLGAVRKLFTAVENLTADFETELHVIGCGTTGSGRKFIGQIIGADQIINEISAHVQGAMETDPQIDTIFEIGGQDSKYMRTVSGNIRDANMNFICAAGTGSFVEEQANKLGFSVAEIGEKVIGITPPETSDRCTVFMEEDTNKLLRLGFEPVEAVAAVMNSVVKNYLNKVVGNREVSKNKVFFQGATARNKGLVAAFENLLDVEVVVSPLCHQMGSYGVALLTAQAMADQKTASAFRGFDLSRRKIELRKETCEGCNNLCRITFAAIDGESDEPSWGYMCGKDPSDEKRKVNKQYRLFRARDRFLRSRYKKQTVPEYAPVVGLPASLTYYSYLPFWTAFFNELGLRVETTPETDERIKQKGSRNASGDFCFPVKVAIGHALELAESEKLDWMVIPQVISDKLNEHTSNSLFCPYVQSHAGVMRSTYHMKGISDERLLTPVLDLRWDDKRMIKEMERSFGGALGVKKGDIKKALNAAFAEQKTFEKRCADEGKKALAELEASGEKAIVVIGRPYNCFDPGANLGLPEKISEYGHTVIPIDFMPFDPRDLGEQYRNIYWNYGQRIIATLLKVASTDHLYPIYLSNFSCGPDSFLLTYAEQIMGERPLLILELDEHGADAGYMTRVEAFLDVVSKSGKANRGGTVDLSSASLGELKKRTLWLVPMHPFGTPLAVAAFRKYGYDAHALPPEDRETYEIGRAAVRGSECLPTHVTTGAILRKLKEINAKGSEHALFMATATGPCRFGQYHLLQRMILDRHGYKDLKILAPSSYNSYQGLEEGLRRDLWLAFLASDVLMKMGCKVRPYEINKGQTKQVEQEELASIYKAIETGGDLEGAIRTATARYAAIPTEGLQKPLVGVVGEIYVRGNPFSNGYVIDHIEKYGGEAWLTPLSEWFLYTAYLQSWTAKHKMRNIATIGKTLLKNRYLFSSENKFYSWCHTLLHDRHEPTIEDVMDQGRRYLPINFEGEAILTVGRAIKFAHQGACLVVNCAPFGCMPGTLTASIFQEIESELGVPMVSMYYDGEGEINRRLEVYIHQSRCHLELPDKKAGTQGA